VNVVAREEEPLWTRFLPALLVPASLLTDLGAALPLRTYFFRDFGSAFFPLRELAARELREGRFPAWNPYVFEGTFQLPATYPTDLLFALWPSPVFASWLLTLHLPLAALSAYWLARELGARRLGAFASGLVYALGGLALSCVNLYVFLQALALAPLVTGLLRRATLCGGRAVAAAAAGVAASVSTLAIEFVGQACLVGTVLGPRPAVPLSVGRLGAALGLGATAAALPRAHARLPAQIAAPGSPRRSRWPTRFTRWSCSRHSSPVSSGRRPLRSRPGGADASSRWGCRTSSPCTSDPRSWLWRSSAVADSRAGSGSL
jgi:hypothetical protein